jgi:hypothetical protein
LVHSGPIDFGELEFQMGQLECQMLPHHYGHLGIEKNAQAAVPVALLLQQRSVNVRNIDRDGIYPST